MSSFTVFSRFVKELITALNERLSVNSQRQALLGNFVIPKKYHVWHSTHDSLVICKGPRTGITLKNEGFVGNQEGEIMIRITGPGGVSIAVYSHENVETLVPSILQLDSI